MQIATLSYRYNPKENVNNDKKPKSLHRHLYTTRKNPPKQRQSFLSNLSTNSHAHLPPIETNGKRPSSIRVKGSGLTSSSKSNDISTHSSNQPPRSRSQQSNKSGGGLGTRSRSTTPSKTSKSVRLKFGYPVHIRSSDFYASEQSESELRYREDSFVNDSIRSAHHGVYSSTIPKYEPLGDPYLRDFFQSSLVLDVVRKTLNIDLDERPSGIKRQSKTYHRDNDDYHRIVAKHSSGYSKLNGYNCIPAYAAARHRRSTIQDKHVPSTNSSLISFPTTHSSSQFQLKRKFRRNEKIKQLTPIATSSPLRRPTETTSEIAAASNVPQD